MHVKNKIAGLLTAIIFLASANICAFDAGSKNTVNGISPRGQSMLPPTEASSHGRAAFSKNVNMQVHEDTDITAYLPFQRSYMCFGGEMQRLCQEEKGQYIFGALKSEIMRRAP